MADAMQESFHDRMGTELLSQSRLLAEAEGRTVGAAAAVALSDPVAIDVVAWNPLPDGVSNASLPMFYALVVILAGFGIPALQLQGVTNDTFWLGLGALVLVAKVAFFAAGRRLSG